MEEGRNGGGREGIKEGWTRGRQGGKERKEGRREGGLLGLRLQAAFVGRVVEEQGKSLCLD